MIQGITQWVWGWRKRGWKTAQGGDVLNRDLWEQLSSLVGARARGDVDWRWVRGHVGTPGNERADRDLRRVCAAATRGPVRRAARRLRAADSPVAGRHGPAEAYGWLGVGAKTKVAAYSYLSVVGGVPMRHVTWAECEGRVKGQSGARFKKAASADDESAILRGWGIDPGRV